MDMFPIYIFYSLMSSDIRKIYAVSSIIHWTSTHRVYKFRNDSFGDEAIKRGEY
jgi:hypothetical protein